MSTAPISAFPMMNWFEVLPHVANLRHAVVVDGGATGSRAALVRADGALRTYAEGGPTSGRAAGNERALANLAEVVAGAIDDVRSSVTVDYCLITSAAVDTRQHSKFLCEGLARALDLGCPIIAVPDTLGCWAITNELDPAVAVVAGTGSVVLAAHLGRGLCHRLGGWDFLLGDEGSGFGIGRAVLRETMRVGEGRSSAEQLATMCLARLDIQHPDELPDRVTKRIDKALIASLAEEALDLAAAGDTTADDIVDHEVASLVQLVSHAVASIRDPDQPPRVGQFGGLFRSSFFAARFEELVRREIGRDTLLSTPTAGAIIGGFSLVLWRAGVPVEQISRPVHRLSSELTHPLSSRERG